MKNIVLSVFIGGVIALAPSAGWACACGCGVFDVGTSSMLPQSAGGMAFVEFDFQDQGRNWSNTGPAPTVDNGDRQIRTDFTTYGLQYMFNRSWGFQVEVPYDFRDFKTLGANGLVVPLKWSTLGDIRLEGIFTGFSEDMSSGLNFGVKLPTGSDSHNDAAGDIDRDTEIGTGSTDLLLGGFHRHRLTSDGSFTWYAQGLLDVPVLTQGGYRPGVEFDGALGIYYKGWMIHALHITPLAQVIGSVRTSDIGDNASGGINDENDNPPNNPVGGRSSGYQRVLLSPGIEFDVHQFSIYADAEFPVVQDFIGNQLVAPFLFKMYLTYHF
jgi:hypothetical protein